MIIVLGALVASAAWIILVKSWYLCDHDFGWPRFDKRVGTDYQRCVKCGARRDTDIMSREMPVGRPLEKYLEVKSGYCLRKLRPYKLERR